MTQQIWLEIFDEKSILLTRLQPGFDFTCGIPKAFVNIPGKANLIELYKNDKLNFTHKDDIYVINIYNTSGQIKFTHTINLSNQKPSSKLEICKACNGKGEYIGLGYLEKPCKICGGIGKV